MNRLKVKVIMLPTEDVAIVGSLAISKYRGLFRYKTQRDVDEYMDNIRNTDKPQHLYFTNGEPKDGDKCIIDGGLGRIGIDTFQDNVKYSISPKKIVATTDASLKLPLIPQSFIELYVKKKGEIEEVEIEMQTHPISTVVGFPIGEVMWGYIDLPKTENNYVIIANPQTCK